MTVTIDGNLGIITPSLTATVITVDQLNALNGLTLQNGSNPTVTLYSGVNLANWALTLPIDAGLAGQYLTTNGAGVSSWAYPVNPGAVNHLAYYASNGSEISEAPDATINNGSLTLGVSGTTAGEVILSGVTSGAVTIGVPAAAGTWNLTLPDNDGFNGQVLTTDGNGVTSWTSTAGSGTVSLGTANQLAYYSSTGIVVDGNSNATVNNGTLSLGTVGAVAGSLVLAGSAAGSVTIATNAIAGGWILTLPATDGNSGQALITDGSGNTSWADVATGTVNSGTANQLAYYASSGNAISGNSNVKAVLGALTLGTSGATAGSLILAGSTSGEITLNTAAIAGTWTLTLPATDGSNGQVLSTDGSGVTSWISLPSASLTVNSTSISGGTSGRILYDNAGTVGEKTVVGSGNVVLATSPTITTPVVTGLNETKTAPTISGGTLTLNCSAGNVFSVSLNANITTLTFTNVPTSGTSYSLTLSFTADGSARTITWGASVLWPNGAAPTLTSTNGKVDTFVLYTFNAGTTWYAFTAGQNS